MATKEQLQSFVQVMRGDDMDAINQFFVQCVAITPNAVQLKDAWLQWYPKVNWWESEKIPEAKQRLVEFMTANATDKKQRAELERFSVADFGGPAEWGSRAGEIEAVHSFIANSRPVTPEATRMRDEFIRRWDSLGWTDINFPSQALYDEMKNRENQFWIANRPPEERKIAVKVVQDNPMSPRQTSGGVLPSDERLKDVKEEPDIDRLDEQIEDAKPFFEVPQWVKTGGIIAVFGGVGLGIYKIVTSLNPVALAARFMNKKA